jgi:hypothetical protein
VEPNRLADLASKDDSVFNKLSSRTEKVLDEPIAKYIPSNKSSDKSNDIVLFNYLSTSEKAPLNNAITSGNVIDYTF